jgi:tetratricopeptide (TPR) repeat protein
MNGSPDKSHSSADVAKAVTPDKGELRARLDKWILWVREHIDTSADITSVLDLVRSALDSSDGKELLLSAAPDEVPLERLESCWGDGLAQAPIDLGVRAAVLCCAWCRLALTEAELDEWSDPEDEAFRVDIEESCTRARRTLALLVRFLPVEDCANTWRDSQWEILNSYIIRDWDRATRLYNRAEDLRLASSGEVAVFRGQFRFLVVFGARIEENARRILKRADIRLGLDSLFWEQRIYGSDASDEFNQLKAQLLFENGMCDSDRELILSDSDKALLLDAANDLQKAFLSIAGLPYPYRGVLAKCHYCIGHFHDAAEEYNTLLQGEGQSGQPKSSARLLASLSRSYRQAGETEHAKEILEQWGREFPDEKGIYLQLAELEAQAANYHRIAEYLRKEIDRNPAVEADWKLSALLALGTTQDTSKTLSALKGMPLWQPVYSMLQEYWPPFPTLEESAREEWACGVLFVHLSDLPERTRLRKAAEACARAVEIELRERIFRKYKVHTSERPSVKSTAEEGLRDRRSAKLCEFLVRDGKLALGEMSTILRRRGGNVEPVFRDFQNWLSNSQLRLLRNLEKLEPLLVFRSPAVHEARTETDPGEVIRSCRLIIEALN